MRTGRERRASPRLSGCGSNLFDVATAVAEEAVHDEADRQQVRQPEAVDPVATQLWQQADLTRPARLSPLLRAVRREGHPTVPQQAPRVFLQYQEIAELGHAIGDTAASAGRRGRAPSWRAGAEGRGRVTCLRTLAGRRRRRADRSAAANPGTNALRARPRRPEVSH
jgi:hypothetical protein